MIISSKQDQAAVPIVVEGLKNAAKRQNKKFRLKRAPEPQSIKPVQRSYLRDLNKVVEALIDATNEYVLINVQNFVEEGRIAGFYSDDVNTTIERAMEFARLRFLNQYSESDLEQIAKKHANEISKFNASQIDRVFARVLSVNIIRSEPYLEPALKGFIKNNVSLIKSISDEHFKRIEQTMFRDIQAGKLTRDIQKDIQKTYNVTRSRAALIARDQTAKFNGNLTKLRHQEVGVKKYKWSTSGDERVRESHRAKNGKIFSWDNPPSDTGHPGEDYQCRCAAIPVFDDEE